MMAGVLSSLRYLLADIIGDDEEAPPLLPDGLPGGAAPIVSEAIDRLIDYQGPSYASFMSTGCGGSSAGAMSTMPCSAKSRG